MNIITLLENSRHFENNVAYIHKDKQLTFNEVYENALSVATKIAKTSNEKAPIVVISDKDVNIPSVYLGIAYSNCFYVPISTEMPKAKIDAILGITEAKVIITDTAHFDFAKTLDFEGKVFTIEECIACAIDMEVITKRKERICDKNPLYTIFTSGSSGTPKGVVTCHSSVVDYITTFVQTFNLTQNEVFGNQAPLDYIAGIRDIYIPLLTGCKSIFIPKNLFSTPKILFDFLNENKVTTICWVSAALSLCCQLDVFSEVKPLHLRNVFFTGSVLHNKYLNMWKSQLPHVRFINHYGPTEITASCTYYVVDNSHEYTSPAPIGKAFSNREVFILNNNSRAKTGEVGEICVRGDCLALGYYKDFERTKQSFVQNPLNTLHSELIYKTGDLGYVSEDGNLIFVGRMDNQIKHMGHRVELGEIENLANIHEKVDEVCCLYNHQKGVITLFYSGSATAGEISKFLRESLPSFMIPRKFICLDALPKLFNGKIDRQSLIQRLEG